MADPNEDKIDFQKLEKELSYAMEADAKYWRENDAKFRAVEQRVETYEQFRDIVAASHLKPLDRGDKEGLGRPRQQPWNPYGGTLSNTDLESRKNESLKVSTKLPSNGHEFIQQWKRLGECEQEKYNYLLQFNADQLFSIFKNEISFGLLGEILKLFNLYFTEDNLENVFLILWQLSNTNRFSLSIDFLSKEEKKDRDELMDKLQRTFECGLETKIDCDLNSLRKLYGCKTA
ncbi:coiled-coil domain-containing protein 103-like isoform X2 [Anneissia japonica]|nr:coiled-coil domain-containing protein 103-like isoform X2 [Anneissia japonica]XP_033104824.1 coiled-coil domain-containing protein 103-like isoform X2 [Anneissia japonica]XP_033104825.1 coiled-coil domain-containing protein 103-like isoform X2 [Anneissia japonica]